MTNDDVKYILKSFAIFLLPGLVVFLMIDYGLSMFSGNYAFELTDPLIKVHWIGITLGFMGRFEAKKADKRIKEVKAKRAIAYENVEPTLLLSKSQLVKNILAFLVFNTTIFVLFYFLGDYVEFGTVRLSIEFYLTGALSSLIIFVLTMINYKKNKKLYNMK